jgi:hypothetical protein
MDEGMRREAAKKMIKKTISIGIPFMPFPWKVGAAQVYQVSQYLINYCRVDAQKYKFKKVPLRIQ